MKKLFSLSLSLAIMGTLHSQTISTFAGNGSASFSGDGGPATAAELNGPNGLAIDAANNLYIYDLFNQRIRVINTSGIISTIAGNGIAGFSGDGGPATAAEINVPSPSQGVAVDAMGNVYITDWNNFRVRVVNTSGIISTFAGNSSPGNSGDGGPATAAELTCPEAVATDGAGNVYIADECKNRVRVVNSSGIIKSFAGSGFTGFSGDGGQAVNASFGGNLGGISTDAAGNVYIADYSNERIRRVNTSGIINTVAGNGSQGFSGDGGQATLAKLNLPVGASVDGAGNIYVADAHNDRIRAINTSGIISTIAGIGFPGFSGDGGPATAAELFNAVATITDGMNNFYIADQGGWIRKITGLLPLGVNEIQAKSQDAVMLYPNPSNGKFTIQLSDTRKLIVEIYNVLGELVKNETLKDKYTSIDLSDHPGGIYLYLVVSETGNLISEGKFVIEK